MAHPVVDPRRLPQSPPLRGRLPSRRGLLVTERPRVTLVDVDEDLQRPSGRTGRRHRDIRTDLAVVGRTPRMTSRPRALVNTNCERFSRARSSTRSTAAPRRRQSRTGNRSTISGSSGHSMARWNHLRRAWPHVTHLQHDGAVGQRQAHEVRERRSVLGFEPPRLPHRRTLRTRRRLWRRGPARSESPTSVGSRTGKPKRRVPSQRFEVGVGVEDLDLGPNRDRGDQAVHELADRVAVPATGAVQRRSVLVVGRQRQDRRATSQQPAKVVKVPLVPSAGEHLHAHRIARGHVRLEQRIDSPHTRLPVSRGTPPTPTCRRGSRHARRSQLVEVALPARSSHATGIVDVHRFGGQRPQREVHRGALRARGGSGA